MSAGGLYRPCVGIALFNQDGRVFVGERLDTPGSWQMPQGGIDENEDIEVAALRELYEETGITAVEILEIMPARLRYDMPAHLLAIWQPQWKKPYVGQEQTWIAMRFTGTDANVRLDAHEPVEFGRWQWARLEAVPALIVPFKREVYAQVITAFEKYAVTD